MAEGRPLCARPSALSPLLLEGGDPEIFGKRPARPVRSRNGPTRTRTTRPRPVR